MKNNADMSATAEIDDIIKRIDDELLILYKAPQRKEYKYYNFGVALKRLIDNIQKHGLSDNPYYSHKIQEYIAVYKDFFGGTDLKNNMVSKIQPDGTVLVSHAVPPKASKVLEWLYGCKVDYSAFASDKFPNPNIILAKYIADEYSNESEYHKAYIRTYQYLTEVCWNVGHKFNFGGKGRYVIMTFDQYISNLKAERGLKESDKRTEELSPDMELFESYFIPHKKGWWDKLMIDIPANLKSGKGGYTVVAMAKVIYDSGKLHPTMKPNKFAPWLRAFCEAWGITKVPSSKASNPGVESEIDRIRKVFCYFNTQIPK